MSKPPVFRTRARIFNQLGEQLIKNESIALLELIKNAYDADATKCSVEMKDPQSIEVGKIIIEDNGEGMDYNTLVNAWLEIGTSYKQDLSKTKETMRSNKFKRLRLGEKGIGRFGVHRLGKKIKVITRKKKNQECVLDIDWDKVGESKYVEDLPVNIKQRTPLRFRQGGTGTRIIIKKLRVPWTRGMARSCARSITSLNSPFDRYDKFRVDFTVSDSTWLDGLIGFAEIEEFKLFSFDIEMAGNQLTDFKYEFTPWPTMKKLSKREVIINDDRIKHLTRMFYKDKGEGDEKDIDLSMFKIGKIRFKGLIFDRDARILDLGVQDKDSLKKYLNHNGGVRVFRDRMRVLDYGEAGNDWLDLDGRRVNIPAKRISNNIILGAVFLDRQESSDLVEKANREGFVENDAFWELWRALRFAIDRIESLRKTDKDLLRKHYGPKRAAEPVITSISELKDVIYKNVKNKDARNEIGRYLNRIQSEYETITNSLIKSAGAGLNLILVIHQIQKIIKEIISGIKKKAPFKYIEGRTKLLSDLVEGYSILVKKSQKKSRDIKELIEKSLFNLQFRFEDHGILIDSAFKRTKFNPTCICSEDHVISALMNIYDNSIWWLKYGRIKQPSIFIDVSNELPGFTSVVIADNGPGFTMPTEQMIKPFVSDKPDGMGIGLHLTHKIMESLGGKLIFSDTDNFEVPGKYLKGAIISLAFKKGVG